MTCILLVEDEHTFREMLADVLRDAGFQIVDAASGDAAAELLEFSRAELIITDINMPGQIDGIDLAFIARKSRPEIPVIFISSMPEKLEEAHALGNPVAFLQKPFRLKTLMTAVNRLAGAI